MAENYTLSQVRNMAQEPQSYTLDDINAMARQEPAAVQVGREINSIPRQIGLTARYGLEGLADTAQVVTEPIRYLTDRLTGSTGKTVPLGVLARQLADKVGLPAPQDANERVVADATRLMAGVGGMAGAGGAVARLPGMAGRAGEFFAANPTQQLAAAAGAGLAGGASRESGGDALAQSLAALGGGVVGGSIPRAAESVGNAVARTVNRLTPQQMDQQISATLQRSDMDFAQLPETVRASLRNDLARALRAGEELDPQAVRRLADFRLVGATPTRGMVSQNPVQITREMNLAKIGANTADEGLQGLAQVQNQNNSTFIRNLNEQGAARGNIDRAGARVTGSVLGTQADLRAAEQAAWNEARNLPGYRQPIQAGVLSDINRSLDEEGLMPFMNPAISRYMEAFQQGQPFTPQAYRNLQSMLSNELQKGGNEAAAARIARNALERAELRPVTGQFGGGQVVTPGVANAMRAADAAPRQAIDAVNQARQATRAAYAYEDSSPLVRSVLSEGAAADPTRIARRFVIGGTPSEARAVAQQVGEAGRGELRDAIVAHLKDKAINGAADDVGKFSQSAYNKALRDIGQEKLALFFTPQERAQLEALGRVASYAQVQPVGSAVNNSNSGALMLGKGYDGLRRLMSMVPLGESALLNPLRNIEINMRSQQAQNLLPGMVVPQQRPPLVNGLVAPAIATSGLLAGAAYPIQ